MVEYHWDHRYGTQTVKLGLVRKLGERKLHVLLPITMLATGVVWYLVEGVLGIFLRPLPGFLS